MKREASIAMRKCMKIIISGLELQLDIEENDCDVKEADDKKRKD